MAKTVTDFTFDEVRDLLLRACDELLSHDAELFHLNANERSLTHRLAVYLERELEALKVAPDIRVDCEYNREGEDPKMIDVIANAFSAEDLDEVSTSAIEAITVYPDIVMHKRATHSGNLLVIEAKKKAPKKIPDRDHIKLHAFTSKRAKYQYRFGAFVNFNWSEHYRSCDIRWYVNGEHDPTKDDEGIPRNNTESTDR